MAAELIGIRDGEALRQHHPGRSLYAASRCRLCTCFMAFYTSTQYDQDVTTWSPQGRVHQVEYAMEAVKQGSAAVGLKVGAWNLCC